MAITAQPEPQPRRRPRFRRHDPPPLRLTEDDLAVIRHVGRHRFLRSTHLVRLIGRSPVKLIRRLGALYHNGYLDRPRAQLDAYATAGSAPMIYALGNRGARLLAQHDGLKTGKVDWTDKNREAGRPFLAHALLVADLMVAMEVAVRQRPDVLLMSAEHILARAPQETQRRSRPWLLRAKVPQSGVLHEVGLVPDQVFGLDCTALRRRFYFCLEADRGTMPITRSSLVQTSFQRKLLTYYHAYAANEHARCYGIGNFRVLTLTRSRERMASMIDAVASIAAGRDASLFLFLDAASLAAATDVLALPWTSGAGDPVKLLP